MEESFERHRIEMEDVQCELERLQHERVANGTLSGGSVLARPSMGSADVGGEAAHRGGEDEAMNPMQAATGEVDGRRESKRASTPDELRQELGAIQQELSQERELRMRIEAQLTTEQPGRRRKSSENTCTPGCGVQ